MVRALTFICVPCHGDMPRASKYLTQAGKSRGEEIEMDSAPVNFDCEQDRIQNHPGNKTLSF